MRLLALSSHRFIKSHPGQWLMALIGMAAGVAVMSGVWLMQQALLGSLELATAQLVGQSTVRVQPTRAQLPESVYRDLALLPGAPDLFPLVEVNVAVETADADSTTPMQVLGVDPLSGIGDRHALAGTAIAGALIGSDNAVVINTNTARRLGVSVDAPLVVQHQNDSRTLEVIAIVETHPGLDGRLIMDISTAQSVFGWVGFLSAIEAPASAKTWLENRPTDGWVVETSAERRASAADLSRGMRTNLMAMSLLALAVGLLVVYAVLSFLLVQRRKTLGLMRAIGITQRHVVIGLSLEVAVLSIFGGGLGLVLGTELANALLGLVSTPYEAIYQVTPATAVQPTWGLYASLWWMALVMAMVTVASVLKEAFQVPPGQLARHHSGPSSHTAPWGRWALAPAVVGVALLAFASNLMAALAGLFLVLAALSIWLPKLGFWGLARLRDHLGDGLIKRAWLMLLSARHRLMPAVSALALALALSAGIGMMVLGFRGAVGDWVERLLQAEVYLTQNNNSITPELQYLVTQTPGIEAISSVRRARTATGFDVLAYDLPAQAWQGFEWLSIAPDLGNEQAIEVAFESGQGVLITEPLATKEDITAGDEISIMTPKGSTTFSVLAVFRDYASEQGAVALDDALYFNLWGDALKDSLGLYFVSDDIQDTLARLQDRLGAEQPITLTTRQSIKNQTLAVFDQTFQISWALAWLVGLIASIALISALLAIGIERAREYATLRALGLSPTHLSRLVIAQTLGMALMAAVLALPLSLVIHGVLSAVIQPLAFGWHIEWRLPLMPWVVTGLIALGVGVVAGLYPAYSIQKTPPARLLRSL